MLSAYHVVTSVVNKGVLALRRRMRFFDIRDCMVKTDNLVLRDRGMAPRQFFYSFAEFSR